MGGPRRDDSTAGGVGVPVLPFPRWFRCTACNYLAPHESQMFELNNPPHHS